MTPKGWNQASRTLREILAQPQFHPWNWPSLNLGSQAVPRPLVVAGEAAAVLCLAGVLGYAAVRLFSSFGRKPAGAARIPATEENRRRMAEILALQGEYREALRLTYLDLLASLRQRRFLPSPAGLTDAQCLEAMGRYPAREDFAVLVAAFRDVRYGGEPCPEERYRDFRQKAALVLQKQMSTAPLEQAQ